MMNRFEKRKIKNGIYKHVNVLTYVCIFVVASIITIAASVNRTDQIVYIDEELASQVKESIAFKDKDTQKVAVSESIPEETASDGMENETESITDVPTEPETTIDETETEQSMSDKIRVAVETLNVRAQADEEAEVLGMADEDDVYEVISNQGEWIEINFNGNNGFVKAEFVEIQ